MADLIKRIKDDVSNSIKAINGVIDGPDSTPKDARSVFQHMLANSGEATARNNAKEIITLSNLQMVSGMPPMGDNIVDPPPFLDTGNTMNDKTYGTSRSYSNAFSTGLAGMDYIERNIIGGNFLILVPLDMKPNIVGQLSEKISNFSSNSLQSLQGRLGIADYGLETTVATRRYWRSYTMLLKAAAISLGLDIKSGGYTERSLMDLLPKHIFEGIVTPAAKSKMFNFFDTEASTTETTDTAKDKATPIDSGLISKLWKDMSAAGSATTSSSFETAVNAMIKPEGSTEYTGEVNPSDINAILSGASYINLMKYMTNIDDDITANERLPIISFFINGTVERSYSTQSTLDESKVARYTTDMLRKGAEGAAGATPNGGELVDYVTELAYHGVGGKTASFALSNTSIPKVISDTASDFSYNVKISDKSIGSDPASLIRPQDTWAKIAPFITPVSDGQQNTVVPNSPLYCAAYVKGVMNVPRGAITSVQITTNPQFQTSEGVPTEIDIVLTIQPLLCIGTMPDFGRFFTRTDQESLVAAMFNPMSVFNIIATMCGYNTVLTKYPYSLFSYFIGGAITSIYESISGTGNYVHTSWNDFVAGKYQSFGQKFISK